jgi:hypothetical protein
MDGRKARWERDSQLATKDGVDGLQVLGFFRPVSLRPFWEVASALRFILGDVDRINCSVTQTGNKREEELDGTGGENSGSVLDRSVGSGLISQNFYFFLSSTRAPPWSSQTRPQAMVIIA